MTTVFSLSYEAARALRDAATRCGAGDAELAAILRLEDFRAELVDIQRLAPLAKLAGLPWGELFPEVG